MDFVLPVRQAMPNLAQQNKKAVGIYPTRLPLGDRDTRAGNPTVSMGRQQW
jgi:hypothetical protein